MEEENVIVAGKYKLIQSIGAGAFGEIFSGKSKINIFSKGYRN